MPNRWKRGNVHVRRILFQAGRASLRAKDNPLKAWYQRLAARKPGRVALVALARKLLVIIYTLLKTRLMSELTRYVNRQTKLLDQWNHNFTKHFSSYRILTCQFLLDGFTSGQSWSDLESKPPLVELLTN